MKEYKITILVYSDITTTVKAKNEEEAKKKAVKKAIKEKPLVSWLVDEISDWNIEEIKKKELEQYNPEIHEVFKTIKCSHCGNEEEKINKISDIK